VPVLLEANAQGQVRLQHVDQLHAGQAAHRKALFEAFGPEQVVEVGRKLYEQALLGDVAAAKVWLGYLVGRPSNVADPDDVDSDELRRLMSQPLDVQLLLHALGGVPTAEALEALKNVAAAKRPGPWLGDGDEDDDERDARLSAVLRLKAELLKARARKT
jgi:hypothetical protein